MRRILVAIEDAMEELQGAGFLYRDLKTKNVLLTKD